VNHKYIVSGEGFAIKIIENTFDWKIIGTSKNQDKRSGSGVLEKVTLQ
jgi:hypothetical protein